MKHLSAAPRIPLWIPCPLLLVVSCRNNNPSGGEIDLLLTNGKIWTGTEAADFARGLAISGDRIHSAGSAEDPVPSARRTIDLPGRLVKPGFNDSSEHFASGGQSSPGHQSVRDGTCAVAGGQGRPDHGGRKSGF